MSERRAGEDVGLVIEWVATLCGVACVWLLTRQNIWSWPIGLVQACLFACIFFDARLYSDFLLHLIYVGLQLYGWWKWLHGGPAGDELCVTRLGSAAARAYLLIAALGTACVGYLMHRLAGAALPYWDASILVLSLIAQFLLARKVLESWLFWITVDVVAIGVYLSKELYVTTGLYVLFLGLAVLGWWKWRQTLIPVACGADADSCSASSCPRTADISS